MSITDAAVQRIDQDLNYAIDDLAGAHEGIDQIAAGIRTLAVADLTADQTMTVLATLGALPGEDVFTAIGLLIRRLSDADTNPALRTLPAAVQQTVREYGEQASTNLSDLNASQDIAEAIGAIDPIGARG